MNIITSKTTVKAIITSLLNTYRESGAEAFIKQLHTEILKKKIRFPLLEHAALMLYQEVPSKEQIILTDKIIALKEIGSNVLAGIILQLRLEKHFDQSIEKAIEYITSGNEWYVCDIIGERVMGHALLTIPVKTVPVLETLARHNDKWIVRSVGVATHYAVKKGLDKPFVEKAFRLLLSLGNTTDFHTKKGIGWAAKTIAKFYPDIIAKYRTQIDSDSTKQWFKTKVKIGLSRTEKYAHRYNS